MNAQQTIDWQVRAEKAEWELERLRMTKRTPKTKPDPYRRGVLDGRRATAAYLRRLMEIPTLTRGEKLAFTHLLEWAERRTKRVERQLGQVCGGRVRAELTLLPCPFCGGPAELFDGGGVDTGAFWFAGCVSCHIEMHDKPDEPRTAVALWNRRAPINPDQL